MARCVEDPRGRALLDDGAAVHERDGVGDLAGEADLVSPRREPLTGPDTLTAAERRVADAAAAGGSNREIAGRLFLSPKTVEMHLGRVYRKLDIRSRTGLPAALGVSELPAAA